MRGSFDSHSSRRCLAVVLCVAIGLAGCGTSGPVASENVTSENTGLQGRDLFEENAPTDNANEPPPTSIPIVDEVSETSVAETPDPVVDQDAAVADVVELTGELPRTTAAGIRITTDLEQVDFNDGNGTVNSISYHGTRGSDLVGAFLDPAFAATPADRTDSEVWVSSSGILLIVFHAGPGVTEMVLESSSGDIDRAAPGTDGVIVMAVPGSSPAQVEARALDSEGNVLATCSPDDLGFLGCS